MTSPRQYAEKAISALLLNTFLWSVMAREKGVSEESITNCNVILFPVILQLLFQRTNESALIINE